VVQGLNKKGGLFNAEDEWVMQMLCTTMERFVRESLASLSSLDQQGEKEQSIARSLMALCGVEGASVSPGDKATTRSRRSMQWDTSSQAMIDAVSCRAVEAGPATWPAMVTQNVLTWDINWVKAGQDEMLCYIQNMMSHKGLLEQCKVDEETWRRFTLTIRLNYNDNPYHNWRHGVAVMHGTFMLLHTTRYR